MINQSFLRVALSQHDLQHDLRFTAIAVDKGVLRYTRERYRQEHGWTVPSHPLETSEIIKELSDENYRQIVHRQKKNDFEEFSLFRLATPTWDIFRLWLIRYYEAQRTIAEGERKLAFLHAGEHDTPIVMMYQGYVQIYYEALAWALQREEDATHSACRSIYTDLIAGLRQYQGKEKRKSV